jgi:hypothetical protein
MKYLLVIVAFAALVIGVCRSTIRRKEVGRPDQDLVKWLESL